jgi:hypothetical protein
VKLKEFSGKSYRSKHAVTGEQQRQILGSNPFNVSSVRASKHEKLAFIQSVPRNSELPTSMRQLCSAL